MMAILHRTHGWWRPEVPAPPARLSARESFPWMLTRLLAGELVCLSSPDELPDGVDRASLLRFELKSTVAIPLSVAQRIVGVVSFGVTRRERQWSPEILQRLLPRGEHVRQRARPSAQRRGATPGARRSRTLERSAARGERYLRRDVESPLGTSGVGQSAAIRRVQEQVCQVAETDATVLLLGETGSGKEVFASRIHELSRRRGRAMVRVNCAAIPSTLIESELFGREKGAYTGALSRQVGRFELADRSTIFLDEIGDLASDVQVKLLRVLEDKQFERLGSSKATKIDTRIIAATHRDLEKRIAADHVPRRSVLPAECLSDPSAAPARADRGHSDAGLALRRGVLGGVRQAHRVDRQRQHRDASTISLARECPRAAQSGGTGSIGANSPRLTIALPQSTASAARRSVRLADVEKEHIKAVLDSTRWRIRGAGGAAEQLGLKPTTLETRMVKLGLQRSPLTPTFRGSSAILGIPERRAGWPHRSSIDDN